MEKNESYGKIKADLISAESTRMQESKDFKNDWMAYALHILEEGQDDYTGEPTIKVSKEMYDNITGKPFDIRIEAGAICKLLDLIEPGTTVHQYNEDRVKGMAIEINRYRHLTFKEITMDLVNAIESVSLHMLLSAEEAFRYLNNALITFQNSHVNMEGLKILAADLPNACPKDIIQEETPVFIPGKRIGGKKHKKNPFKYR